MAALSVVTGGAGFIGSHLTDELVRQGQRVRILDDFSTGMPENLIHHTGLEIVRGTITDPADCDKAIAGATTVFHLGALASVARSVETPLVSHAACATGTLHVLDSARRLGVKRVVFAGSSSAYGGAGGEDSPQSESILPMAKSPYAAAKLAGEHYMQAFTAVYGLETVRLRFFNIFGPRQRADSPYSGVIAIFIKSLSEGRRPTIHGDGLQSRDFTYVANAVQALVKASTAPAASGNVYNVGTGNSVSVNDLVAGLNRALGTNLDPVYGPPRDGDVKFSKADVSRTKRDLGYEPAVSFAEGLAKTVEWYRSQ
jgi:UDP-glucose 4-epimerase